MNKKSLLSRSIRGLKVISAATGLIIVINFVSQLILVRLLAPEVLGSAIFALMLVDFAALFPNLQAERNVIVQQGEIEAKQVADVAFSMELCLGIIIFGGIILAFPTLLGMLDRVEIIPHTQVLALILVLDRFIIPKALSERNMDFFQARLPLVFGAVANASITLTTAWLGLGVWSIIAGRLTKSCVQGVTAWIVAPYRPRLVWDVTIASQVWKFGGPLTGAAIVAYFYWNIDDFMVGRLLGNEALGYYWLAFKLPHYLLMAQGALASIALPAFSNTQNDTQLQRGFELATRYSAIGLLPICGITLVLGRPTIRYLFGETWLPATAAFQIFMVLVTVRGIFTHWTPVLTYKQESSFQFKVILFNSVILTTSGYLLLSLYNLEGMALAVLFTILLSFIFMVPKLKSILPVNYSQLLMEPLGAFVLATLLSAGLTLLCPTLNFYGYLALALFLLISYTMLLAIFSPALFKEVRHLLSS